MSYILLSESASPGTPASGKAHLYVGNEATPVLHMIDDAGNNRTLSLAVVGRATAQVATNASVATVTVGAADGTFIVSANVLVTTATTHDFDVQCTYTDEGNTARTVTMPLRLVGSTTALVAAVVNANGAVPYIGVPIHIRVKTATAITIRTEAAGTYTTVTYNVEGFIQQIA